MHTVGTEFFYMDADNQNFKITTMQNVIRPNRNPLFQTLKPLYSNVGIQEHRHLLYSVLQILNIIYLNTGQEDKCELIVFRYTQLFFQVKYLVDIKIN